MLQNRKIKIVTLFLLILFVAAAMVACGGQKGAEQPKEQAPQKEAAQEKIVFKMVGTLPIQHHVTKASEVFKSAIEKNSNGKIEVQFYPAQQLYNDKDVVNVLPKGSVEMAVFQTDFWPGLVPSLSAIFFPTYYSGVDHLWAIIEGEPGKIIAQDFEEKANCKILGWLDYGDVELLSKKPVKKLEDFKGLRVRSPGENCSVWLKAVGAAPVTMSSGEAYQALQRGTVDGVMSGPTSFLERKWYEVAKNMTEYPIQPGGIFGIGINLDIWKKLSPDLQNVLQEAAKEAREYNKKVCADENKRVREELKKLGVTANPISEEEQARWRAKGVPALIENYKQRVGAEKAQKILDAAEALRKK